MMIVVTIVHVFACIVLVLVVLLQAGKGADMGAVFGGASSTIFGSSGAGNFLTRLTTGAAIVFMITSLTLTYGSSRSTVSTIMPVESTAPVESGGEPEAGAVDEDAADAGADTAPPADQGGAPDQAASGQGAPAEAPAAPAPVAP